MLCKTLDISQKYDLCNSQLLLRTNYYQCILLAVIWIFQLPAPFEGQLTVTGDRQITIDLSGIKGVQLILENVQPYSDLHDTEVNI